MRILAPVDGSDASTAAVKFIASRSTLIGTAPDVELLNVQPPTPNYVTRVAGKPLIRAFQKQDSDKVLKPALAILNKAGLKARARYVVGHAGVEVGKAGADESVDLIVMGSHGRTALKGLVFGSVTSAVLAGCSTPLLLVRDKKAPKGDSLKVGIALDGSDFALAAVRYYIKHQAVFGDEPHVTLIHAVPDLRSMAYPTFGQVAFPTYDVTQLRAMETNGFEAAVGPARKLLDKAKVRFDEERLTGGNAGDQIAAYATKSRLDVLLMGSHGYGVLKSVLFGSVATRVAARGRTPLLLIRRK